MSTPYDPTIDDKLDETERKLENALDCLDSSYCSSAAAVADHIRTVAENGEEQATLEYLRGEAESLRDWAQYFLDQTVTQSWEK